MMMMITVFIHSRGTDDCVYICDITAIVLVIFRIAANSKLRQKVLDLVLISKYKVLPWSWLKSLGLGLGLDKKVLFTRLP